MTSLKAKINRSQASIEYLQTYAWAILVIMFIGIVLWQLGVFDLKQKVNTASGFKVIQIAEPSIRYVQNISEDGLEGNKFKFTIYNAGNVLAEDVFVSNISGDCSKIFFDENIWDNVPPPKQQNCENAGGIWVPSSGPCYLPKTITLKPGDRHSTIIRSNCDQLVAGEPFEVDMIFYYSERIGSSDVTHKDAGIVRGYVESVVK